MKKVSIAVLSAIMAMLMLVLSPTQIIAKAEAKLYVEDIIIVAAKDEDEAQKLAGEDYLVLGTPIYDGSADTGDTVRAKKSFLCYKTTSNPTNAITEIKALNMNAPWDYDTYNNYLKQIKKDIKVEVKALCRSIEEFQSNYGANTEDEILYPKAIYAYNVLQYLYDDDILTHENEELRKCARLGDLFLAFDFEDEDSAAEAESILADILLESNAQCVNIIYNALTLACSETEETSFLDIISGTNFKANNYINANEFNDYADDIINTISETQREIKKYLESQVSLDESIFKVPAELAGMEAKLKEAIEFEKSTSKTYYDQYIETVLQTDPASLYPAERRVLIENAYCELTWYKLDDAGFMQNWETLSFEELYYFFNEVIYSFSTGALNRESYDAKIKAKRALYENKTITVPKAFEDLMKLFTNDLDCYSNHSIDQMEVKTGENLYNIFKACAYRGYENNGTYEYETLYDLVMKHDMTGEVNKNDTYKPSDFYPIIAQLSDGQRGMLKTGILNLALSVVVDAEQYEKSFETLKTLIKDLAKDECRIDGVDPDDPSYSIFGGIDRELFKEDNGVAMMESATKRAVQEKDFTFAGEDEKYGKLFQNLKIGAGVVAGVAFVGAITCIYLFNQVAPKILSSAEYLSGELGILGASDVISAGEAVFRTAFNVFGIVFTVAIITLIIISLVYKLMYLWKTPETADYIGIPRVVCNAQKTTTYYMNLDGNYTVNHDADGYVYYYGIKNPTLKDNEQDDCKNNIGKFKVADVANWSQTGFRQWIALYTTKDLRAGQPILASSLQITDKDFVFGKRVVSMFSDGTSCDMQKYFNGTPIHKYLHYVMDKDYKPFTNDAAENANEAGSVFAEPSTYAVGGLGLLLGVAGGCGFTAVANKNKKKKSEGETA